MSGPPQNAPGPADSEARTRKQKLGQIVVPGAAGGKALVDVTQKSRRMPRNSSLLFPNQAPRSGADWAHYRGALRMLDARFYWAAIWERICNAGWFRN